MDALGELQYFVAVAEGGGFSAAASDLGVSRSYVSRVISGLEERLGARLFSRSTRVVELTEAGRQLLDDLVPLLEELAVAQQRVRERHQSLSGVIRLSVPDFFGRRFLVQPLLAFQQAHPGVCLDVHLGEEKVDVVGQRYDLVVRGGTLEPSALIARRLCDFRVLAAASPTYIAAHGRPGAVADLAQHACIRYLGNPEPDRWTLGSGDDAVTVKVDGPVLSNSLEFCLDAALAGLGVLRQPEFLLAEHLRSGALVSLFPDQWLPHGFHLVYPHRHHMPLRVARLMEHLLEASRGWSWALDPPQSAGPGRQLSQA